MDIEDLDVSKLVKNKNHLSAFGWGTVLDDEKTCPAKYLNADFEEMDHAEVKRFFFMNNEEKFKFAYWAQTNHSKKAFINGVLIGFGMAVAILLVIGQIWF